MRAAALLLVALQLPGCGAELARPPPAEARDGASLALGPLVVTLRVDREASFFHAVDQLSAWYPYHHRAYMVLAEGAPLTPDEQAALLDHRAVRASHGWGAGLEEAFYAGDAHALDDGTRARVTSAVTRWRPRLAPFVDDVQPHVARFADGLAARMSVHAGSFDAVGRLFGTRPTRETAVLVARPGAGMGGGGANGGVLVVEVTRDEASLTPLVHESVHAMLAGRRPELRDAAARCGGGLDATTLEEALVHAIAPGLVHDPPADADPLAALARDTSSAPLGGLAAFYALGLAIRPAMERALETADLAPLLASTCDAWRALRRDRPGAP